MVISSEITEGKTCSLILKIKECLQHKKKQK
jgi:hypothetical protein